MFLCTFGEMTSVNLRKVPRRFCKATLPGEAAVCDAYPHGDRKRGLAKAHIYWYIYFVDPRAFANDIPFEMESPPESARRTGPGQVDAHVYMYVYTRRETAVKVRARVMAKKLLRLKFPGNEDTRHDDLLRTSPSFCDPATRESYCTSKVYFAYRTGRIHIECYKLNVARKWIAQDIRRYRRTGEIAATFLHFYRKLPLQYFTATFLIIL